MNGEVRRKIAVVGLGYVGLPLAVELGKRYPTVGFDVKNSRIEELQRGVDRTGEIENGGLQKAVHLKFTTEIEQTRDCNYYIVAVPTPIDAYKKPDLRLLMAASEAVGAVLAKGDVVIYESTVYPGCTEEDCVPVLERVSGLRFNKDFFCGYSPERINPGDKKHTISRIKKITSGSTAQITRDVDDLYGSIVEAGTFPVSSIRVAEAAKVIENAQRDLNIAFVNELAIVFDRMGIDTQEVLSAARTKWNFLPFQPGLVGGHCIGVDPYYLTHKAESIGYHPQVILAGRRINDTIGIFIANRVIKLMIKKGHRITDTHVLVLGITFKENCPDVRNSKVIDVIRELESFGCNVDVYDPLADRQTVRDLYGIDVEESINRRYDAVVLAVSHEEFKRIDLEAIKDGSNSVVYDVKGFWDRRLVDGRL